MGVSLGPAKAVGGWRLRAVQRRHVEAGPLGNGVWAAGDVTPIAILVEDAAGSYLVPLDGWPADQSGLSHELRDLVQRLR